MTREIDLADVYVQLLCAFLRRPFFAHVAVENLKLFRVDFLFDARDCGVEQIILPLLFPDRVKIDSVRIGHALDRGGETIVR